MLSEDADLICEELVLISEELVLIDEQLVLIDFELKLLLDGVWVSLSASVFGYAHWQSEKPVWVILRLGAL